MAPESSIKLRLRSYFDKYPDKQHSIVDLKKHFNDVKEHNLNYHLKTLIDEEFLVHPKRGVYQKNPKYLSVEHKRELVGKHLENGNGRVIPGEQWKPGDPPMRSVENPTMIAFLGRTFGESILERMKSLAQFTTVEIEFVSRLLSEKYPLSEQQRLVLTRKS